MTKLSDIWGATDKPEVVLKPPVVDPFSRCAAFVHERIKTLKAAGFVADRIRHHLCLSTSTYDLLVSCDYDKIKTDRSTSWVRELADTHLPATSLEDHRKMMIREETLLS